MNVITFKDYADQNNISYEAVRKQVARYKNELGEHLVINGRQQFLDEEAVAFLDAKRRKNPVIVHQASVSETIENLKQEKENLLIKVAEQADQLKEMANWKAEKATLIAEADQNKLLLEENTKKLEEAQKEILYAGTKIEKLQEHLKEQEEEHQEEMKKIQEELKKEKSKSWLKKLFGK